jgi:cytochrome o ubiquinol oxidase subunit 1
LIWHIWWLVVLGLVGAISVCIRHAWRVDLEDHISVATIAAHEQAHVARIQNA